MKLLYTFNIVLLKDNAYKANFNNLFLLEIVSVTSIRLTFYIAFMLFVYIQENNFT